MLLSNMIVLIAQKDCRSDTTSIFNIIVQKLQLEVVNNELINKYVICLIVFFIINYILEQINFHG